ncbi:hypothetical protein DFJ73DRAFT_795780 [Zopfochytrium polystomum]|nr:hypothetical protein DFJ73DRAFT_795780 [Zopfochytrium polystomum]
MHPAAAASTGPFPAAVAAAAAAPLKISTSFVSTSSGRHTPATSTGSRLRGGTRRTPNPLTDDDDDDDDEAAAGRRAGPILIEGSLFVARSRSALVPALAAAGGGGGAQGDERFAMLVAPSSMDEVRRVFERFAGVAVENVFLPAAGRGGGGDGASAAAAATSTAESGALLRCLGNIAKAAALGLPLLLLTSATPTHPLVFDCISFQDVVRIVDEVELHQPCHFVLQTSRLHKSHRFHVRTSFEYTDWMEALQTCAYLLLTRTLAFSGAYGVDTSSSADPERSVDLGNPQVGQAGGSNRDGASVVAAAAAAEPESQPTRLGDPKPLSNPPQAARSSSSGSSSNDDHPKHGGGGDGTVPQPPPPPRASVDSAAVPSVEGSPMAPAWRVQPMGARQQDHPAGVLYPVHGSDVQMRDVWSISSSSIAGSVSTTTAAGAAANEEYSNFAAAAADGVGVRRPSVRVERVSEERLRIATSLRFRPAASHADAAPTATGAAAVDDRRSSPAAAAAALESVAVDGPGRGNGAAEAAVAASSPTDSLFAAAYRRVSALSSSSVTLFHGAGPFGRAFGSADGPSASPSPTLSARERGSGLISGWLWSKSGTAVDDAIDAETASVSTASTKSALRFLGRWAKERPSPIDR